MSDKQIILLAIIISVWIAEMSILLPYALWGLKI
jgi:hypothetical protein